MSGFCSSLNSPKSGMVSHGTGYSLGGSYNEVNSIFRFIFFFGKCGKSTNFLFAVLSGKRKLRQIHGQCHLSVQFSLVQLVLYERVFWPNKIWAHFMMIIVNNFNLLINFGNKHKVERAKNKQNQLMVIMMKIYLNDSLVGTVFRETTYINVFFVKYEGVLVAAYINEGRTP